MLPLSAKDKKNVSALANSHIHSMPSCFMASNKWDARNYISFNSSPGPGDEWQTKLSQGDSLLYPVGAVCGVGMTKRGVRRKVRAEANAWRAVEGVLRDRRISKRLKGKVMSTFVTPACLHGTETLALTEIQQQRRQVCENNWIRKIARVKRADMRERLS